MDKDGRFPSTKIISESVRFSCSNLTILIVTIIGGNLLDFSNYSNCGALFS